MRRCSSVALSGVLWIVFALSILPKSLDAVNSPSACNKTLLQADGVYWSAHTSSCFAAYANLLVPYCYTTWDLAQALCSTMAPPFQNGRLPVLKDVQSVNDIYIALLPANAWWYWTGMCSMNSTSACNQNWYYVNDVVNGSSTEWVNPANVTNLVVQTGATMWGSACAVAPNTRICMSIIYTGQYWVSDYTAAGNARHTVCQFYDGCPDLTNFLPQYVVATGTIQYAPRGTVVTFSCNPSAYTIIGTTTITCVNGTNGQLQWSDILPSGCNTTTTTTSTSTTTTSTSTSTTTSTTPTTTTQTTAAGATTTTTPTTTTSTSTTPTTTTSTSTSTTTSTTTTTPAAATTQNTGGSGQCTNMFDNSGTVNAATFSANGVYTFTCLPNYVVATSDTTATNYTCGASGQWTTPFTSCTVTCPPLGAFFDGSTSIAGGVSALLGGRPFANSIVYYTCNAGYVLSGTGSSTCLSSGQWSNAPSTCSLPTTTLPPRTTPPPANNSPLWWILILCGCIGVAIGLVLGLKWSISSYKKSRIASTRDAAN